jgi:hypothetical protein
MHVPLTSGLTTTRRRLFSDFRGAGKLLPGPLSARCGNPFGETLFAGRAKGLLPTWSCSRRFAEVASRISGNGVRFMVAAESADAARKSVRHGYLMFIKMPFWLTVGELAKFSEFGDPITS